MWQSVRRLKQITFGLALVGILSGVSVLLSPAVATSFAAAPAGDEEEPSRSPTLPKGVVSIEVSERETPDGRAVVLTARTDRPSGESYVLTIRREGGHMNSSLEASCFGQSACSVDVRADQPGTKSYAAALYRCDREGVCVLERDATISEKAQVTGR